MDEPLLDLAPLLPSWELVLRAERKAPGTIATYGDGVRAYLRWAVRQPVQANPFASATAQAFVADLLDGGAEAATAHVRLKGLRRFSAWLAAEGELAEDPLARYALAQDRPQGGRRAVRGPAAGAHQGVLGHAALWSAATRPSCG